MFVCVFDFHEDQLTSLVIVALVSACQVIRVSQALGAPTKITKKESNEYFQEVELHPNSQIG